ncbi:MAG TPA: hypothetical protein VGP07_25640 [Polyangia bacterium]
MKLARAAAVLSLFGTLVLASASAVATERVVFCKSSTGVCGDSSSKLGTAAQGFWTVVDDQDLSARLAKGEAIPTVVYFSRAAYAEAVAGLSAKEKERAILRRLQGCAAALPRLLLPVLREDLLALAIAESGSDDDVRMALDAARILGGGPKRFQGLSPVAAVQQAGEALAKVMAQLAPGTPAADGYRKEAEAIADLESDVRHRPGPRLLPFAAPERVYFSPGMKTSKQIDGELPELQAYGWHGGGVLAMRPDEVAASPGKGKRLRLLYDSNRRFLEDSALTEAQLDRRLQARLTHLPERELAELVASLAFDHAVMLGLYTDHLREQKVDWLPRWTAAVAGDQGNLRLALVAARPGGRAERAARIEQLRADLRLAVAAAHGTTPPDPSAATIDQTAAVIAHLRD